jgi:hypothetical protein
VTKAGEEIEVTYITMTGLAIFLGFESRQSLYDYENRPKFSYTIKRARLFIECEYEEMLRTNPVGAIFALKNFNWTDRQDLHHSGGIDNQDLSNLSSDQLKKIRNIMTGEGKANSQTAQGEETTM